MHVPIQHYRDPRICQNGQHFDAIKMVQSLVMETSAPPPFPPMPREYYHRQAERVRKLAQEATSPAIRDQLAGVAREYEHLAEEAKADYRPRSTA
jgi:hypothetical protein